MFLQTLCEHINQNEKFSKKLYFHHKLEESKDNPQKTWNLLRALLPSNTSFSTLSSLIVNNETFTNPTTIANQLNHHFVNIGKSLVPVTNLSGSNDYDYLTYFLNRLVLLLYISSDYSI